MPSFRYGKRSSFSCRASRLPVMAAQKAGESKASPSSTSSANSAFPPPSIDSIIKDGAISGVLPEVEVVIVHYPGYPSFASRAIETLGGLPKIAKACNCALQSLELRGTQDLDKDRRRFLRLKFRPEDPYCHPAFGEPRFSTSLLLRISRTSDANATAYAGVLPAPAEQLSADVVAKVSLAYHFEGMADYQYMVALHAAESSRKKRPWASDEELLLDDVGNVDMDSGDILKLVPPLFARKDKPEKIVLNPPSNLISESLKKEAVEYSWEMDIDPCHALPFNIDKIPGKVNWEDKLPKGTTEWEAQMAVFNLFEERPIWPRCSLHERLLDDGPEVSDYLLRRLLFRTGYYFSSGPFGKFWIRKGYDPRANADSRIYQKVDFRIPPNLRNLKDVNANSDTRLKRKWKDICKFRVWPSKAASCLQLFELEDDYIHKEIEKPTNMTTCSPLTGWFSETMLKALRLHVMIRFMEATPSKGVPEDFLKSKIEHFKRCKKKEVLSRFWKPEKDSQHCNLAPADAGNNHELYSKSKNAESEVLINENSEEEEEDEEEHDGYESPHMDHQDGVPPPYTAEYEMEDGIGNEYLQELLSGFAYRSKQHAEEAQTSSPGTTDGDYEIYEQDSDADYDDFL